MAPARVLLLTHSGDYFTIDRVAAAVERRGALPWRLDTDRFPASATLSASFSDAGERHVARQDERELDDARDSVVGVWSRRIWPPTIPEQVDERFRAGCERESKAALRGFLDGFQQARWINPLGTDQSAGDKLTQLRVAREVGLRLPRTLVTNDPEAARAFHEQLGGRVVAKLLTPLSVSMNQAPAFVYTSRVKTADLERLDGLRHAPMVFQEELEKAYELRVVCVAGRHFVGKIDASQSAEGATDWRRSKPGEVSWEHAPLPDDVAAGLTRLCSALGIVYSAVDLIVTPAGEHVFLESNPGGEWGMLEAELDLSISEAIADALLDRS